MEPDAKDRVELHNITTPIPYPPPRGDIQGGEARPEGDSKMRRRATQGPRGLKDYYPQDAVSGG